MSEKAKICLLAACLVSAFLLAACNRESKSISTAPSEGSPATTTQAETATTTELPKTVATIVWSLEMDCAACHIMQSYVDSLQDPNLTVYAHAQMGFVCTHCHEQDVLREVHQDVNSSTVTIEERMFPKDNCFRCHGSYADLIARTIDSEVFKAIADVAVNPHKSHEGEIDCSFCHKMHKSYKPIDFCYDCH